MARDPSSRGNLTTSNQKSAISTEEEKKESAQGTQIALYAALANNTAKITGDLKGVDHTHLTSDLKVSTELVDKLISTADPKNDTPAEQKLKSQVIQNAIDLQNTLLNAPAQYPIPVTIAPHTKALRHKLYKLYELETGKSIDKRTKEEKELDQLDINIGERQSKINALPKNASPDEVLKAFEELEKLKEEKAKIEHRVKIKKEGTQLEKELVKTQEAIKEVSQDIESMGDNAPDVTKQLLRVKSKLEAQEKELRAKIVKDKDSKKASAAKPEHSTTEDNPIASDKYRLSQLENKIIGKLEAKAAKEKEFREYSAAIGKVDADLDKIAKLTKEAENNQIHTSLLRVKETLESKKKTSLGGLESIGKEIENLEGERHELKTKIANSMQQGDKAGIYTAVRKQLTAPPSTPPRGTNGPKNFYEVPADRKRNSTISNGSKYSFPADNKSNYDNARGSMVDLGDYADPSYYSTPQNAKNPAGTDPDGIYGTIRREGLAPNITAATTSGKPRMLLPGEKASEGKGPVPAPRPRLDTPDQQKLAELAKEGTAPLRRKGAMHGNHANTNRVKRIMRGSDGMPMGLAQRNNISR